MKISKKLFLKIPRGAGWLIPGLEIKRWFLLIIAGAVLAAVGLCIITGLKPVYSLIKLIMRITQMLPPSSPTVTTAVMLFVIFLIPFNMVDNPVPPPIATILGPLFNFLLLYKSSNTECLFLSLFASRSE